MDSGDRRRCKRCGQEMRTVAEIAPLSRSHGLLAFLCPGCGDAETILVSAADWEADRHHAGPQGPDRGGTASGGKQDD